ncbi:uncharacterized protein EI90DRAFT_3130223 [Cantharellus anzutake]|uniref:uncharacterized protein n=1 Tax=Cantharellus anzutake TaxID=1750568 RepID=UPI001908FB18|nr:uncharacterized protein EI90DRAFT_3130223 [Cantharellus anzutake]KAF8323586.1 hypothetical protein EI90DRAFT_3130223 [Cantharellus anzutake]
MSQTSSNPAATAATTTTSSSIDNPRFPIVALDAEGKNYQIWALRMESVFKVGHMWNVVKAVSDGGEPTLSMTDQNYMEWMDKDEHTYAYIQCHINNEWTDLGLRASGYIAWG